MVSPMMLQYSARTFRDDEETPLSSPLTVIGDDYSSYQSGKPYGNTPTPAVFEVYNGQSLASRVLWYLTKYVTPRLRASFQPTPKGPQILEYPPPAIGQCRYGLWESSNAWKVTTVSPSSGEPKRVVAYMHGSGFRRTMSIYHYKYVSLMAERLEAEISIFPVPLLPNNTAFEIYPALTQVYSEWTERARGRAMICLGDSAGGHIHLGLLQCIKEARLPLPSQVVVISAGPTMDASNPDILTYQKYDTTLNLHILRNIACQWTGLSLGSPLPQEFKDDPRICPLGKDVSFLREAGVKMVMVSGTYDSLHPDIIKYRDQLVAEGVAVHYLEGVGQMHCFPLAVDYTEEARQVLGRMIEVVLQHRPVSSY